jgi:hypothetical protein
MPCPWRAIARMFRILLVALAGAFGQPPPRLLPQQDPICEVRDEEAP